MADVSAVEVVSAACVAGQLFGPENIWYIICFWHEILQQRTRNYSTVETCFVH